MAGSFFPGFLFRGCSTPVSAPFPRFFEPVLLPVYGEGVEPVWRGYGTGMERVWSGLPPNPLQTRSYAGADTGEKSTKID